jgi:hypothetical protein
MDFLSLLILSSLQPTPSGIPASAEELNGMVDVWNCSGAIVSMGRSDSEPALILSAGHCPGPSTFYRNGEAEIQTEVAPGSRRAAFFLPSEDGTTSLTNRFALKSVYYATLTRADVALYEVEATLGELKQAGYRVFDVSNTLPRPGSRVRITSGVWKRTQECTVSDILENNLEEERRFPLTFSNQNEFRHSIVLDSPCSASKGWSGSPVFDERTGMIYGVLSRDYSKEPNAAAVASNVIDLVSCMDSSGKLDLAEKECFLPKKGLRSTPQGAPRSTQSSRSSRWP